MSILKTELDPLIKVLLNKYFLIKHLGGANFSGLTGHVLESNAKHYDNSSS